MTQPFKWGDEFLVNTTTRNNQYDRMVTALADGRFVVTWVDGSVTAGDTDGYAVRAQIFAADGSKSGPEFLVNTTTASNQSDPTIAALDDGRFVVAWTDRSGTGNDSGLAVRGQMFNSDGSKSGPEFLVNTTTALNQIVPTITTLADGRFVVAWVDYSLTGGDPWDGAIRAQMFNPDGSRSGFEFLVNTTTDYSQFEPTITGLPDGRFIVAWTDQSATGGDMSSYAVRAQLFNPDGPRAGPEFLVNTTTFNGQSDPTITALADGRFVVAWSDYSLTGGDNSHYAVRAQVFNPDGSKSGSEFLANTTTTGWQIEPAMTGLADGRFVIAWTDYSYTGADTSSLAVRAQVFNPDGSKSGAEFLVNSTTMGAQSAPTVTALPDGRFVVAWTDQGATGDDTSGWGIRGQICDPRTAAATFNGTTLADDYVGTGHGDWLYGSLGNDKLDGGAGDDRLSGEEDNDSTLGRAGNDILDGGDGNDSLSGGPGADRLIGGIGNDTLAGGIGTDIIRGGLGNDVFGVDVASDLVVENAGEGLDTVQSVVISLNLANYANIENAGLTGAANLSLTGNASANQLTGNAGNNVIDARDGSDALLGGVGDDSLIGGTGGDSLNGGAGADTASYASSATGVTVNLRTNSASGGDAAGDTFTGIEKLVGSGFNDNLTGDGGANEIAGGGGADSFIFDLAAFGVDLIADFQDGSDKIWFKTSIADSFSDFVITGNDTANVRLTVLGNPGQSIDLHGVAAITLTAEDFMFFA